MLKFKNLSYKPTAYDKSFLLVVCHFTLMSTIPALMSSMRKIINYDKLHEVLENKGGALHPAKMAISQVFLL